MPEAPIKRVNFFDGQFLRQGEFLELEGYHRHMRRRVLYMLFDQSGVVEMTPLDLKIEVHNAAAKEIRVLPGTALGIRADSFEAKEIVVRENQVLDLDASSLAVGDIGIVTLHYNEVQTDASSDGGVTGNTRVAEQAVLTVHKNSLGSTTAPNGEPYVRLGNVAYQTLAIDPPRQVAYLRNGLLAPTASIGISPNFVTAGAGAVTLALSSVGLNLSSLVAADITVSGTGVTVASVGSATANSASVTLNVGAGASPTPRTFTVVVGGVTAATSLAVNAGLSVSGAGTVNVPGGDTVWEINGSGFTSPAVVQFTTSSGTASITVTGGNVTPAQLRIPLADFNVNAYDNVIQGPVTVTCGGFSATSPSIVPPARIKVVPASIARGSTLQIDGRRFYMPLTIRLVTSGGTSFTSAAGFPDAALGETRTDTQIRVMIPNATSTGAKTLTIQTAAGTVQHTTTINISA